MMPETLSPLYFYGEFLANYSYTFIFKANFTRFFFLQGLIMLSFALLSYLTLPLL